ncbi:MAG: ATP-binding cassette domain-containing protein [Defluviitaleaceae bacterium]|nr:ATP-binding cassette domain-containing protein [Defluviitaleaceae bacterium]
MLSINNVTHKYGNFTALENISLEFNNGLYGLLSPNGAGKTTLIKLLVTLLFPTQGEILYNGTDIVKLDSEYRNLLGYLPQDFGFYPNYTPVQFLAYVSALKGMGKKEATDKALKLLDLVSLLDVKNKKLRKFSGGMIQRLGIAQAMLNDPKILILDEPTAGLDPKEQVRFRNLIATLAKDRIVILSTHNVFDIETIAHQIIMFKDHKLLYRDTSANLTTTLNGKIFETFNEAEANDHICLTERYDSERSLWRFVCCDNYNGEAKPVVPTLEDLFLFTYHDKVEM